jgi:glyceraldehyde 3-phosphate dehydrogenase
MLATSILATQGLVSPIMGTKCVRTHARSSSPIASPCRRPSAKRHARGSGAAALPRHSPLTLMRISRPCPALCCTRRAEAHPVPRSLTRAPPRPPPFTPCSPDAPIKLGVNGFGRIGRQVVRIAMERESMVLKHINAARAPEYLKYLLEHDTVHGRFKGTCEIAENGDGLIINGMPVSLSGTRDPAEIPWTSAGVDYVCESTGAFLTTEKCMAHVEGGAKKVVISAPAKDAETPTIVVGVNTDDYDSASMPVVSCASCTTNGLAPLVKTINEKFGIKQGLMTTVHAATASQLTVDGMMSGADWRAGRAAAANIIPSSTGAAKAVAKAYPVMKGKLTGMAFRVPTVDVSVVDLTCELETATTYEEIKAEVKLASETYAKGIVGYTEDQVVSSDFVGETCSTVFDAGAGIMLTPTFVKLVSWYDNEWGYSTRLVDLVATMAAADGVVAKEKALA